MKPTTKSRRALETIVRLNGQMIAKVVVKRLKGCERLAIRTLTFSGMDPSKYKMIKTILLAPHEAYLLRGMALQEASQQGFH